MECVPVEWAGEGVVFSEEEHAVALLALTHRHARAVPEGLRHFGLLVFVMTAGAQRTTEIVLVACQPLQHHGGHAGLSAEIRACALGVGLSELANDLQAFPSPSTSTCALGPSAIISPTDNRGDKEPNGS